MLTVTSAPGGADSKRSACGSGLIVIQPGTQEGAVALEHPENKRTMTPLAAMAATSRTRTRHPPDTAESVGCPPTLVELDYEFHLEMWPDCCLGPHCRFRAVLHDKAGLQYLDGPGRREAATSRPLRAAACRPATVAGARGGSSDRRTGRPALGDA